MTLEDVMCNVTPQINSSYGNEVDDYFVDQLLNFNNNDEIIQPLETPHFQQQTTSSNIQQQQQRRRQQQEVDDEDEDALFLPLPLDTAEEADLEWLSHFVDDSSCPYSTPFPPGYVCPKPEPRPEPKPKSNPVSAPFSLKRARRRNRVWARTGPTASTPARKQGTGQQRRCSHCGVQKTPQWRAGPDGSKTLCNACGVRFKSGRLLPEYRPACSPSFSSELHSNNHRKVMEMRMKKKEEGGEAQFGSFHHLSSFG
ncbi:hypothetical protein RND81_11G207200 [Saponaria officinalis]